MIQQAINWLFVVRHDYHTPLNTMRARIVLPFSSGGGLLLLITNILFLAGLVSQSTERRETYVLFLFPIAWTVSFVASYLIQNGHLLLGMTALGALLVAYNVADILLAGTMTTGIIFPMMIIYASLAFGRRGIALAYIYTLAALIAMLVIRSEGRFGTDVIDDLSTIVFFSAINITLTSLMLWLFAGSLQAMFDQVSRVINQTRATSTTGQTISRILNLDELLTETVDLIRDRFAFYHVQIFMVDESRGYANLAASTGEQGRTLLSQGFQVALGPRTVVGECLSTKDVRYVPDITKTAYRHPDVLAATRAVLVLPLIIGDEVAGALDVQSTRPNAFSEEDIETLSVMANQVSQAIHNAQLFESQQRNLLQNRRLFLESETNLREIERLNRQLTGESWQEYVNERGHEQFGVKITGDHIERGALTWTSAMLQAAERRRVVTLKEEEQQVIALPITIRGEPVGAIEVQLTDAHNSNEVRTLLQAVTERLAFSLENARLFEQAQLAAERELQINRITARLQGLTTIEDVLTTAVEALGEVLDTDQGSVRLVARDIIPMTDRVAFTPREHLISDKHKTTETIKPSRDGNV